MGFYFFIYTIWLKRKTPQNIVIGGAAGALPPVIGWTIATGNISIEPIILFLIIFSKLFIHLLRFVWDIDVLLVILEEFIYLRKSKPVIFAASIIWLIIAYISKKRNTFKSF